MIIQGKPLFPDIQKVKEGIGEILNYDWRNINYENDPDIYLEKMNKLFIDKIGLLPYFVQQLKGDQFNFTVYRVRRFDEKMDPNIISEFSYPPRGISTQMMRANLPLHPVFYCSPNVSTTLLETFQGNYNKDHDNKYFISEWKFRNEYNYNIVPFVYKNTSERNLFKKLGENVLVHLKKQSPELTSEQIEVIHQSLQLLSTMFVYENTHIISSYIAHSYLYMNNTNRADVFIYPSVQADLHNVNFAINPNTVTHKMTLEKVFFIKVSDFNRSDDRIKIQSNISLLDVAINKDGILFWNELNDVTNEKFANLFKGSKTEELLF